MKAAEVNQPKPIQKAGKIVLDMSMMLLGLPKMVIDLPKNIWNLSIDIFEHPQKILEITKMLLSMPNRVLNKVVKIYFIVHANSLNITFQNQKDIIFPLINKCKNTMFGKRYGFKYIESIQDFQAQVPIFHYHDFEPWVHYMLKGEPNITYPGKVDWFATSSGTTGVESKFIPVTKEGLKKCHFKPGTELFAYYLKNNPRSQFLKGKGLVVGGGFSKNPYTGEENVGFISAILQKNTPWIGKILKEPQEDISYIEPWEKKLDAIVDHTINKNITFINGQPGWLLNLLYKVLEKTGKKNILEVRPNMQLFFRGGLPITLYKSQFEELMPSSKMKYYQIYNASEGFFGIQGENDVDDMVLMVNHGTFYEFISIEEYGKQNPNVLTLEDVQIGEKYAIVITNYSGLRRYVIGDIVEFTCLKPWKIKIVGRTKYFIDMIGERVFLEHIEKAVFETCKQTNAVIAEYTVGPHVYHNESIHRGAHERIIEFVRKPEDMPRFADVLDEELGKAKDDYKDERTITKVLGAPIIHAVEQGTFYAWLKHKNKLGGQHKVPKLSNDRRVLDDILALLGQD